MHFLLVLAVAVGSVQGVATVGNTPLPGCTVTLKAAGSERTVYTDVDGKYRFNGIAPGAYELLFELSGLNPARRSIEVSEGANAQPAEELTFDESQMITFACSGPPCEDRLPETVWNYPTCDDYFLDEALIESMKRGDQSAIELARVRYARATTYAQKHQLAGALLGRVADDRAYWNELFEHARNSVRFRRDGEHPDELRQWCAERGYDPDEYEWMAYSALWITIDDHRSHPLLLQALESNVESLVEAAIAGLAKQGDLSALPAIARALDRFSDASIAAYGLVHYRNEKADELALRYMEEEDREVYLESRNASPEE